GGLDPESRPWFLSARLRAPRSPLPQRFRDSLVEARHAERLALDNADLVLPVGRQRERGTPDHAASIEEIDVPAQSALLQAQLSRESLGELDRRRPAVATARRGEFR